MAGNPTNQLDPADAKDLRNNKALMSLSVFLTVVSLLAFFWLAGVLDWRGSEGRYNLRVAYDCEKSPSPQIFRLSVFLDQEDAKVFYDALDFDAKTTDGCTTVVLDSDPAILEVDDAFNRPIAAALRDVPLITGTPSGKERTVLTMAQFAANGHEIDLRYKRRALLEYIGLSERSITMSFDFPVYTGPTPQQAGPFSGE